MVGRRHRTTTEVTKPTLMTRLKGPNARHKTYKTEVIEHNGKAGVGAGSTARHRHHGYGYSSRGYNNNGPVTRSHHRRKPSVGDKISGAMMRLRGSLTRKPGEKAAGTRRMRGTDGRGSRRIF